MRSQRSNADAARGTRAVSDIDHRVATRIRERRIMLGLSQRQMAEMIGVGYALPQKYESGRLRISSGRLFTIAQALQVDVGDLFDGLERHATTGQPGFLDLSRSFIAMPSRRHREAICDLARALAYRAAPVDAS